MKILLIIILTIYAPLELSRYIIVNIPILREGAKDWMGNPIFPFMLYAELIIMWVFYILAMLLVAIWFRKTKETE